MSAVSAIVAVTAVPSGLCPQAPFAVLPVPGPVTPTYSWC